MSSFKKSSKNNHLSSQKKVKSSSGRKQGYRMSAWQKDIQRAACREDDLEGFNKFMEIFVYLVKEMRGKAFYIIDKPLEKGIFFSQESHIFLLEQVNRKKNASGSVAVCFFRNVSMPNVKVAFRVYDLYIMMKNGQFYPVNEEDREDFFIPMLEVLERGNLDFPDKDTLRKRLAKSLSEKLGGYRECF